MDSGMDEYMDAFVWIYMGRCMDLDGLHAVALRLDNDSKYLHYVWTMTPSQRLHIERGCENV